MKIYEHDFVQLKYRKVLNQKWVITSSWQWADRSELFNNSNYKLVNREKIEDYTPNRPFNLEREDTVFPEHEAFTGALRVSAKPWIKFRSHNGHKYSVSGSSPEFTLHYKKGFDGIFGSDIDFDQLELGVNYGFDVTAWGEIDFALLGGVFFNRDKMYFMDFKHFLGNQTPFITNDPIQSFRLMDYYRHSTTEQYFVANVHYQFRKFLVTTLPVVRLAGIREVIFLNYLKTPTSRNYTELGYSIDGILRMFRLEIAAAFENGDYLNYGFRIGIASNLMANFND
jgi:hypothetical protein